MRAATWHSWTIARVVTLTRVYFTFVFGWAISHALFSDRWAWLFLFNSLAVYLFAPLPVILAMALFVRRRETWIGFAAALTLGAYLYGGLFLPKPALANPAAPTLSVMSYNMLGFNEHTEAIVATIRAANADVVAIQELNPRAADTIRRDLTSVYPFQVFEPRDGVTGMGVISRYPLHSTGKTLPGAWVGAPQVLTFDWNGTSVTLLNFHSLPTSAVPWRTEWSIRERERQAQAIAELVAARPGPFVAAGDLNATDQSAAYAVVTNGLRDAWREAGWGLGHTFPGAASIGNPRLVYVSIPMPTWLVRIDYVFHSRHWRAVSAEIGPWDGASDHRPVVAKLSPRDW